MLENFWQHRKSWDFSIYLKDLGKWPELKNEYEYCAIQCKIAQLKIPENADNFARAPHVHMLCLRFKFVDCVYREFYCSLIQKGLRGSIKTISN